MGADVAGLTVPVEDEPSGVLGAIEHIWYTVQDVVETALPFVVIVCLILIVVLLYKRLPRSR